MSRRDSDLLWLRDMLEHLTACHQQLEWARDAETVNVVIETMMRDLESCRRLCESMQRNGLPQVA